jgi:hypothetical protein
MVAIKVLADSTQNVHPRSRDMEDAEALERLAAVRREFSEL